MAARMLENVHVEIPKAVEVPILRPSHIPQKLARNSEPGVFLRQRNEQIELVPSARRLLPSRRHGLAAVSISRRRSASLSRPVPRAATAPPASMLARRRAKQSRGSKGFCRSRRHRVPGRRLRSTRVAPCGQHQHGCVVPARSSPATSRPPMSGHRQSSTTAFVVRLGQPLERRGPPARQTVHAKSRLTEYSESISAVGDRSNHSGCARPLNRRSRDIEPQCKEKERSQSSPRTAIPCSVFHGREGSLR